MAKYLREGLLEGGAACGRGYLKVGLLVGGVLEGGVACGRGYLKVGLLVGGATWHSYSN